VFLVGFLHLREFRSSRNLDAECVQVRKKFSPLLVSPDMNAPGTMRRFGQWSAHGLDQKRSHVVAAGSALDMALGQHRTILLHDDHAQVVRLGLHDRLRQRPEVGLPGVVLLT
jgi:hypothetical protein